MKKKKTIFISLIALVVVSAIATTVFLLTSKDNKEIAVNGLEKIDVLSTTYESGDDFAEYFDIMQKYKNKSRLGFRFL